MSTFLPVDERIGAAPITDANTVQQHAFGTRRKAIDATLGLCEFVYVKGVASGALGSVVFYVPNTGVTALATARSKGLIAVFMSVLSATTLFGWAQVLGVAEAKAATVVAGATVYLTGTPGTVDDAVVAGDIIYGANFATADGTPSAGFARVSLANPYAGDTDNA